MEAVTIADKVRFWQEQDRINRALIPRLIKIHETAEALSRRLGDIEVRHGGLEAKLSGLPDVPGLLCEIRRLRLYVAIGLGLSFLSSISALIMTLVK